MSGLDLLLAGTAALIALVVFKGLWDATRIDVDVQGLRDDSALTLERAQTLDVAIRVDPAGRLPASTLTLDGEPADAEVDEKGFRWAPGSGLTPGRHRLELKVPRPVLGASNFTWDFVVDAKPPVIDVPGVVRAKRMDRPVTVEGSVEPDARLWANGKRVDLDDQGRFTLRYERPPAGPINLLARDSADHRTRQRVFVPVQRPTVRGIHLSGVGWADPVRRKAALDLIDAGKIDTIQLDLKDEGGEVVYDSKVPLARRIGAVKRYYDLSDAVEMLHGRGVRVIGRVVAFRDPILAVQGWKDPEMRDWVLQDAEGRPITADGGYANLASDGVQRYNLDIAMEGVAAGVDEILWDYIRRPVGELDSFRFVGLQGPPDDEVVAFLGMTHRHLRAKGVYQGASVFGVAAKEGHRIAQDIPKMSRHVDYLAPMVYPSLWGPFQYEVPDPPRQPALIVGRSLARFQQLTKPMGIPLTPWLQDYSLNGVRYGDAEVRVQIDAAAELGIDGFLLWNPSANYHAGQLAVRK